MGLGYETFEDERNFIQEGLTGEVRRYSTENIAFPCLILVHTDDKPVKLTSVQVLKQMTINAKQYDEEQAERSINVYYNKDNQMVTITKIQPSQVKSFLKLFSSCNVDGYLDKNTKLTGMYLYVLAE